MSLPLIYLYYIVKKTVNIQYMLRQNCVFFQSYNLVYELNKDDSDIILTTEREQILMRKFCLFLQIPYVF